MPCILGHTVQERERERGTETTSQKNKQKSQYTATLIGSHRCSRAKGSIGNGASVADSESHCDYGHGALQAGGGSRGNPPGPGVGCTAHWRAGRTDAGLAGNDDVQRKYEGALGTALEGGRSLITRLLRGLRVAWGLRLMRGLVGVVAVLRMGPLLGQV